MINSPLAIFQQNPIAGIVFILSVVVAITVHEFAHAWTAMMLGDPTPVHDGRVTLNPAAHIDPVGGLMFLLVGFGYGRPVIYNPMRLRNRIDELWIALAGPASNIVLALIFHIILFIEVKSTVAFINPDFLNLAILVNLTLAAFNMIPIPPLDGSSIIAYFWPPYRSLVGGQIGLMLLIILILISGSFLSTIMTPLISIFGHISSLFGLLP